MILKYKNIALGLAVAATCSLTSCSDAYMAEVNTDTSKAETVNPNSLLTTALLETYGDFGLMDTYRSYITGFTQQFAGGWNVTSYAGSCFAKDDQESLIWDKYYSVGMKNLQAGIENTTGKAEYANVNAIMRIHRVYMFSVLTDVYGDVPVFEAGTGKATPKYDTQEEIYKWFFTELEECIQQLGTGTDGITGDVTAYNGNINMWKRYANSLRMRFAMRVSDVEPELAKAEFEKSADADCGYISQASENAYVKYMNVPYTLYKGAEALDFRANAFGEVMYGQDMTSPTFVCKTFFEMLQNSNDPRLWRICRYFWNNDRSEIRPDAENIDVTTEIPAYFAAKGLDPLDFVPEIGTAWYDNPKEDWAAPSVEEINQYLPSLSAKAGKITANNCNVRMKIPFFNIDMERPQTPGILLTSAEVNFLLAEAASKGWNVPAGVETYFDNGVKDAMYLINDMYLTEADCYARAISGDEINNYLTLLKRSINLTTTEGAREAINTQAYILHVTNPVECWANLRRADYPVLKDRNKLPMLGNFTRPADMTTPVRLHYPQLEFDYNNANYEEVIDRMGGSDDWSKRVWWDTAAQHVK